MKMLHPSPHIPTPHRPPRPPFFGDLDHLRGLRLGFQGINLLKSLSDAKIIHWQQVGAIQHENQEHFRGPAANSFDGDQALDDFFVGHFGEATGGDFAVGKMGGEVAEVTQLLAREAGGAELLVGECQ